MQRLSPTRGTDPLSIAIAAALYVLASATASAMTRGTVRTGHNC